MDTKEDRAEIGRIETAIVNALLRIDGSDEAINAASDVAEALHRAGLTVARAGGEAVG